MKKINRTLDMSKKDYNKPMMRVTELHHVAHLLSESDTRCTNPNPEEPSSEPTDPPAKIWHWQVD